MQRHVAMWEIKRIDRSRDAKTSDQMAEDAIREGQYPFWAIAPEGFRASKSQECAVACDSGYEWMG